MDAHYSSDARANNGVSTSYSCDGRASGVATHCSSNVEDDGAKTRHSSNTAAASPGAGGVECTRACS